MFRLFLRPATSAASTGAATDAAHELGVFGVPTVAVENELFWGDDRLQDAAAALERRAAA
jgi:2-hydroxychromene-2-carboxylate isomerase